MVFLGDELVEPRPQDCLADVHEAGADVDLADIGLLGVTLRDIKDIFGYTLYRGVYTETDATVVADVPKGVMYPLEERVESDADPMLHNPVTE